MTNYSLAHDSDASITIVLNWDTIEETVLDSLDKDSILYIYMLHDYHN